MRYTLVGVNGNARTIINYVVKAMKEAYFLDEEIEAYKEDATSDDYNHLIDVSLNKIDICNERIAQ
jgi:hypothetical protein